MRIDVWSDLVCPWCGIGAHRLDEAIARFEHAEDVEVVHHHFELDPGAPVGVVQPMLEMLQERYGADPSRAAAMCRQAEDAAAGDDITPYHVADNVVGSTSLAHQMLALAAERGLEHEAWRRLFRAYFGERRSIFTAGALAELGEEIGLDGAEVRQALASGTYAEHVRADAMSSIRYGASGVPFFVIDGTHAIPGAQSADVLLAAMREAWKG